MWFSAQLPLSASVSPTAYVVSQTPTYARVGSPLALFLVYLLAETVMSSLVDVSLPLEAHEWDPNP